MASKKKKNQADVQKELRELTKGDPAAAEKPPLSAERTKDSRFAKVSMLLSFNECLKLIPIILH